MAIGEDFYDLPEHQNCMGVHFGEESMPDHLISMLNDYQNKQKDLGTLIGRHIGLEIRGNTSQILHNMTVKAHELFILDRAIIFTKPCGTLTCEECAAVLHARRRALGYERRGALLEALDMIRTLSESVTLRLIRNISHYERHGSIFYPL